MRIIIKKDAFKNLATGSYDCKVKFKDGEATGVITVVNKITFTITGLNSSATFTASEGMTWTDWIRSYGISHGYNNIVGLVSKGTSIPVYLDSTYTAWKNDFPSSYNIGDDEMLLYEDGRTPQFATTVLKNGASYSLDPNIPV